MGTLLGLGGWSRYLGAEGKADKPTSMHGGKMGVRLTLGKSEE